MKKTLSISMGSSSLYNVWEDNALFMSLRIRKYTRQCQESHTSVFNQLIRSFISCKFTAYFWEINHDISLINLKISVEKEGKISVFIDPNKEWNVKEEKNTQTYVDVTNEQLFFVLSWWEKQFFFISKVQQLLKVIEITYNMQTHIYLCSCTFSVLYLNYKCQFCLW